MQNFILFHPSTIWLLFAGIVKLANLVIIVFIVDSEKRVQITPVCKIIL